MKYYLNRFWLALSVSFYLFMPYLSRYIDAKNRFGFHWTQWDLISLLSCIVLVGIIFFLCFVLLCLQGNRTSRKAFEFSFIAILGIALMANISHLIRSQGYHLSAYLNKIEFLACIPAGIFVVWIVVKNNKKIKKLCITSCFLVSPIIILFTFNALRYKTLISDKGAMPIVSEMKNRKCDDKMNIYIFIFDEWSYQRSFNNKTLIKEFRHLKQFANQALVFHKAVSPGLVTDLSMPALLFQNKLRFVIGKNQLGFQDKQFHPLKEVESVFRYARTEGFYTAMIGHAMPYGELLGEDVDFCKSICGYKRFGDGFLDVAKYHLLTAFLMLPDPFFHSERKLITHYFFNRFQLDLITTTHDLFKTIVHDLSQPTFAVFHYNLPHLPYIFTRNGYKKLFAVYKKSNVSNYYGNLAYLDEKIGEIISTLKKSNKFDNSLIIMTTDHSWRFDPSYDKTNWKWISAAYHIPLFIKMPHQNHSIEIHNKFETFTLGNFIKKYLNGNFTLAEVEALISRKHYFSPTPLESNTGVDMHFSK